MYMSYSEFFLFPAYIAFALIDTCYSEKLIIKKKHKPITFLTKEKASVDETIFESLMIGATLLPLNR